MRPRTIVAATIALAYIAASGQSADPVVRVYHPPAPPLSYEVATIKPIAPLTDPRGRIMFMGQTVRGYIRSAYSSTFSPLSAAQVVGGPAWINKDHYAINGKPPAELETAMRKIKNDERVAQDHNMAQSLLADRFHLKVHFEVREMPIYELVPAKGGLKITAVDAPPPREPGGPPRPPPAPGKPLAPGTMMTMLTNTGLRTVNASATTMTALMRLMSDQLGDTGNRPILDHTGFVGNFNITNLQWAPLGPADATDSADAPSFAVALEENLGIKLAATKGPVEVVVIDSIDPPSEN